MVRAILIISLFAVIPGCKGKDKGAGGPTAADAEEQAQIAEQEDDLLARRDALLSARQQLQQERANLAEQRKEIRAKGGDTADIDEKASKLLARESDLVSQEADLNTRLEKVLRTRRSMMNALAAGDSESGSIAAREATLAAREKELARREEQLGAREARLAGREENLATKWKESCASAQPTTIVQTVDVKGSKYTKKDVEPLLSRARRAMNKKGILRSDLPPEAQGLEAEATKAMAEGDYGRARFAAVQLSGTVKALKIDKAFLGAKFKRLNATIRGKKLKADDQKEVDKLFRAATANYADGKYSSANRKLNRIYAAIQ